MIELPSALEAQALFDSLGGEQRLFTLSPAYALADGQRDSSLEPLFFVWQEEDHFWLHSTHRGKVAGTHWFDLQSPYGYGGPVANCDDPDFLARATSAYRNWCEEEAILAEFVRFHPLAENWRLYGGSVKDDRQTVAIALDQPPLPGYSVRARTAVRKAMNAGIHAHWLPAVNHAREFGAFYRQAMAAIHAEPSYHFGDAYFLALMALPGVRLLACRLGGVWLAAGLFLESGDTLEYHLSAASEEGKKWSATHLLLHQAAQTGHESGRRWLYLGGGTDSRENNPLLFFKAGFSSRRFPFRIGYQVFQPAAYEEMKAARAAAGQSTNRVLFYRS